SGYFWAGLPRAVDRPAAGDASGGAAQWQPRGSHRPGRRCSDQVRIRFRAGRSRSCVAYHQEGGSIGSVDQAIFSKAGLFICADRACIRRIGIRDDAWSSCCQQAIDKRADENRAVAAIEHVRFADELIDAARALGLRSQAIIPGCGIVALEIAEWPSVARHDVLMHGWFIEIAFDEIELLVRRAPPFTDGVFTVA